MRALIEARLRDARTPLDPLHSMQVDGNGESTAALQRYLAGPHERAAVLIGLIERATDIHVLLTRRAEHLAKHPGQVAFPGGRIEADDSSAEAAALREAHEEIGLRPDRVELIGRIQDHITGTGFIVTPFVGFIPPGFVARPDPEEVADVFEVPFAAMMAPDGLQPCTERRLGTRLRGYELRYGGERVWGATAAMLVTLKKIIYETK
jgi:8-oxo-dGTP pyrophosphatase MutT (NUDIX family)